MDKNYAELARLVIEAARTCGHPASEHAGCVGIVLGVGVSSITVGALLAIELTEGGNGIGEPLGKYLCELVVREDPKSLGTRIVCFPELPWQDEDDEDEPSGDALPAGPYSLRCGTAGQLVPVGGVATETGCGATATVNELGQKTPEQIAQIRQLGEEVLALINERGLTLADSVSALLSAVVALAESQGLSAVQALEFMTDAVMRRLN